MPSSRSWAGWVGFAAMLTVIIGVIDFFLGLIAVIRGEYFAIHGDALIVFDTTAWGWVTMLLGIAIILVGLGLASGAGFSRWLVIVLVVVNLIEQLAWLGNSGYPLWTLTVITLQILVLYALTVRWGDSDQVAPV